MTYIDIKKILLSIDDPVQKLEMVMDFGKTLLSVPDNAECHEILGCSSKVEICISDNSFYGRADSSIVRGVVAIILAMIDGHSIDEIRKMDIWKEFSSLNINLGVSRIGGVNSIIRFLQNL